jgi:protein-disulfide isomerase
MTSKTYSIVRSFSGARRLVLLIPLLLAATTPSLLMGSDVYMFSTIPGSGNISGAPGATIGWGYSITNESTSDWLLATNLGADSFAFGTPTLLFDFPEVAPGATVTEVFDPIGLTGLYEDVLNDSAPNGSVDSGDFVLSAQWYEGDPFNGGTLIGDAVDTDAAYTATVTSSSSTPEPSSFVLLASGILLMIGRRLCRLRASLLTRQRAVRIVLLVLFPLLGGLAQDGAEAAPDTTKDAGITREQADDILTELRQIRQLLERQVRSAAPAPMKAVPQTGKLRLDGGFFLGSSDAPVTIVEFSDYQCPYCRQFESTTFAEIRKKYIDTGKVRFVVRDFPLVEAHPYAMRAAEAAHCAGDQGQFWAMHDALFGDPTKLGLADLMQYAETLKLDSATFLSCIETDRHKLDIQKDIQVASSLQITATPSFLIGKTTAEEVEGPIVIGAQPLPVFEAALNAVGN